MRVVQFFQVVVLLLLLGYAVLVYLENPVLLRLPLPFAGRELVLPAGLGLGLGVLAGALYATLLILPRYLRQRALRRSDTLRRRDAETRLQATLQAVVDGTSFAEFQTTEAQAEPEVSAEAELKAESAPVVQA
jgi:lipopolysaccharide assembly protein A